MAVPANSIRLQVSLRESDSDKKISIMNVQGADSVKFTVILPQRICSRPIYDGPVEDIVAAAAIVVYKTQSR